MMGARNALSLLVALVLGLATTISLSAPGGKTPPPKASASSSASSTAKSLSETLTGDAKSDYDAAKVAFGDKDYAGAEVKFQAAYQKSKDPRLLWNIAACEKQFRHYTKVRSYVQQYLADGGTLLTAQDRAEADELLRAIEPFMATLDLKVNEADAEIFVDDEKVGISPLGKPIDVDVGTRKIRVKKAGFVEHSSSTVVGDKQVTIEVTLVPEVHMGTLSIHVPKGARISIDGNEVGVSSWSGPIKAGGHTLRVTAVGMRSYQSEITVGDGEVRTVDIALEPEVQAAVPEKKEKGPTFELGLRGGYGIVQGHGGAKSFPLELDLGIHLGRPTVLGIFAMGGRTSAETTCGLDAHGPTPVSEMDTAARYSFRDCFLARWGVGLTIHTLPRGKIDPWFAIDLAFIMTGGSYRSYSPLDGYVDKRPDGKPFDALALGEQAGLHLGVDFRLLDGFQAFAVGPYLFYTRGLFGGWASKENATYLGHPDDKGGSDQPFASLLVFGLRTVVSL